MALPGTDGYDDDYVYYGYSVWTLAAAAIMLIALESGLVMALLALGLIVAIVAICAAGYGVKLLVERVQMNALTHTEEWQDERFRIWVLRELEPPCKKVGHEYLFDNTCFWCGKQADHVVHGEYTDSPPEGEPLTSWDDYYAHAAAVEAHYRGEDEPIPEPAAIESEDEYQAVLAEHNKKIAAVFGVPPNLS